MSTPAILRPAQLTTNERGNGAKTTPLVSRRCGSTALINGITAFDPGSAIGLHYHNCEESVMVIEGDAIVEIDGVRHSLGTNDTTWLPANVPHRFLNETDKPMRIFWTYATVDATRTMIETGQTHTIDAEHEKGTTTIKSLN